jgi:hypothetical protein
MPMILIVACGLGLLALVGLVIGLVIVARSSQRDTVSTARQGWMDSRTERDSEE